MLRKILHALKLRPAPRIEDAFSRAYTKFYEEMRRSGMSAAEIDEEFILRRSHARIRRIVSTKTMKQPQRYQEYLAAAVKEEGHTLQKLNKKLGLDFLKIMKGFRPDQILYPDALAAFVRHGNSIYVAPMTDEDSMAALSQDYRC